MAKSYQEKMQEDWTREHTRADKQRQKPTGTIAREIKRAPTEAAKSLAKSQRQKKADTTRRAAYEIVRNRGESAVKNALTDTRSIIRDAIVNDKKNKGMGKTTHKK